MFSIPIDHVRNSKIITVFTVFTFTSVFLIQQVCFPGLHITLGIYNQLFDLLEEACQELDLQLAVLGTGGTAGGSTYHQYVATFQQLHTLREEQSALTEKFKLLKQVVTYLSVTLPAPNQCTALQQLYGECKCTEKFLTKNRTKNIVPNTFECAHIHVLLQTQDIHKAEETLKKISCKDGPFSQCLTTTLNSLHVERQAYHGATFVGNHVH